MKLDPAALSEIPNRSWIYHVESTPHGSQMSSSEISELRAAIAAGNITKAFHYSTDSSSQFIDLLQQAGCAPGFARVAADFIGDIPPTYNYSAGSLFVGGQNSLFLAFTKASPKKPLGPTGAATLITLYLGLAAFYYFVAATNRPEPLFFWGIIGSVAAALYVAVAGWAWRRKLQRKLLYDKLLFSERGIEIRKDRVMIGGKTYDVKDIRTGGGNRKPVNLVLWANDPRDPSNHTSMRLEFNDLNEKIDFLIKLSAALKAAGGDALTSVIQNARDSMT
jgi:hypothetical protein